MIQNVFNHIFIIASANEDEQRRNNVAYLKDLLPNVIIHPAIFPSEKHIPFLNPLQILSEKRTGHRLNEGEIGVLLSNRAIWRKIVEEHEEGHFLILESDSCINTISVLLNNDRILENYDLFFWGGWYGNILLKRSTIKQIGDHSYGDAIFKTVCSCYGYSINKKAAKELLKYTGRIAFAVDEFKRYLPEDHLRIGAILPEVISELPSTSSIGHPSYDTILFKIKMLFVNMRNHLKAFYS